MRICFVILHYMKADETAKCIDSILNMSGNEQMQILIVNNSLNDDSGRVIEKRYSNYANVHVIPSEENAGFSRANNIGYRYALEYFNPDFIVAVNNDIEFIQKNFKEQLKKIYQQTHFAVLGPDVLHAVSGMHQSPINLKLRSEAEAEATIKKNRLALRYFDLLFPFLDFIMRNMYENKGNGMTIDYEKQYQNVVLLGACLIFSKEFFECCEKAFYPETNFFYEEYILAYRCKQQGFKMIYAPEIKVLHESGASTKSCYKNRKKQLKYILDNTLKGCQVYLDYRRGKIGGK